MTHRFGDRERFAIEISPAERGSQLRAVDLFAAGIELCCDGNAAFVPQFCLSVEATITWLLSDDDRSLPYPDLLPEDNHRRVRADDGVEWSWGQYKFTDWGPTTDNVSSLLFRRGADAILTFEFWRATHPRPTELGRVFVVELPERELLRCLHQAVCVLRAGA